jgi:hypothetical protein
MTPPAVSAPPPSAAPRAEAPAPAPALRARAPFSRPRHARPPLLTGRTLSISLILHLLLLLGVLFAPAPQPELPWGDVIDDGSLVREETVEYLDVTAWGAMATEPGTPAPASAAPITFGAATADSVLATLPNAGAFPQRAPLGIPAAPAAPSAGGQPGAAVPGAAGGAPGAQPGGAAGRGRSGPGGLGPEFGDPRLVVRPSAVPEAPIEDEDRYQRHIRGRLQAINDSISGEADRQRRANDWTFTDRNGRKWGINERGPVVGGRNVPIPIPLPNARRSREQEDAARREAAQRAEMDRQEEGITRDRYLRDRGRAIRERENQRREAEKGKQEETTP